MILISHRGNISKKDLSKENHPAYIDNAIKKGFQVEIDIWLINNEFFLGNIFNIFKDENQQKSYMKNWDGDMSRKKIESLNRGKYSKSTIKNIMNKKIKNEVRSYTIKILHQTVMTGGEAKIGDKISMGAMREKSDDYEEFEMNVFLPMWEKQLLNGKISQWSFAKVIDKNEAANDVTHMTFIFRNKANPGDVMFMPNNEWLSNKIVEQGLTTREFWPSEATLVYMSN